MLRIRTVFVVCVVKKQKINITPFGKNLYFAHFKMKLGDQDKNWALHVIKTCAENLRQWLKGTRSSVPFGTTMVRRKPQNHYKDCYFYV